MSRWNFSRITILRLWLECFRRHRSWPFKRNNVSGQIGCCCISGAAVIVWLCNGGVHSCRKRIRAPRRCPVSGRCVMWMYVGSRASRRGVAIFRQAIVLFVNKSYRSDRVARKLHLVGVASFFSDATGMELQSIIQIRKCKSLSKASITGKIGCELIRS